MFVKGLNFAEIKIPQSIIDSMRPPRPVDISLLAAQVLLGTGRELVVGITGHSVDAEVFYSNIGDIRCFNIVLTHNVHVTGVSLFEIVQFTIKVRDAYLLPLSR